MSVEFMPQATEPSLMKPEKTQLKRLHWLESYFNFPVYAKLEFQQKTGSFKYRGALNALLHRRSDVLITASAGNHALALATAAKEYNIECKIIIPINASKVKKEKLIMLGAEIIQYGHSLGEAGIYAQKLASSFGWDYVSPFSDERVINANASLFDEILEQLPDCHHLLVPVGGGGLLSGAIMAKKKSRYSYKITGVEPEVYASVAMNLDAGKIKWITNTPTLADGLAVQLSDQENNFSHIKKDNVSLLSVSEEEIATSCLTLLNKESWLVEGAAGVALSGLFKLSKDKNIAGPVVIILTGGNIQKSALMNILSYNYTGDNLNSFISIKGERITDALIAKKIKLPMGKEVTPILSGKEVAISSGINSFYKLKEKTENQLATYYDYCKLERLNFDSSSRLLISEVFTLTCEYVSDIEKQAKDTDENFIIMQRIIISNVLMNTLNQCYEWRSSSYEQAKIPQFFSLSSQNSPNANYDRYQHESINELETDLIALMGISSKNTATMVTSSGMAAFSTIEAYLNKFVLQAGDKVCLAPYIYFEATEQIEKTAGIELIRLSSYSAEEIYREVLSLRPKVLFLDPLANIAELRYCDVLGVLEKLNSAIDYKITVIIDGTMCSAQLPLDLFNDSYENRNVEVIYYESGSKYLQLGYEFFLAGVIIHDVKIRPHLERMRRNLGSILYAEHSNLFPKYTREDYLSHLVCMEKNAIFLAENLHDLLQDNAIVNIYHPKIITHEDYSIAKHAAFVSGCLCIRFNHVGLNSYDNLNALISATIRQCDEINLPIVKGVSFGFCQLRISAASAMAENQLPFLRINAGTVSETEIINFSHVLAHNIKAFFFSLTERVSP